jgi:hypothetical protein
MTLGAVMPEVAIFIIKKVGGEESDQLVMN